MEIKEKDLIKLTYAELEEEADNVLKLLSDDTLPLDDAAKLYEYGKKIAAAMEENLTALSKKVTDTVQD